MKLYLKIFILVFIGFSLVGCKSNESSSSNDNNSAEPTTTTTTTTTPTTTTTTNTSLVAEQSDMASVSAMGTAVSSLNDVLVAVDGNGSKSSSNSDSSEKLGNVYPSNDIKDSSNSNPFLNADNSWKFPNELGAGVYEFELSGSKSSLTIGEKDGDYWPLTLKTEPVSDLNISYTVEKIWTKDGNWDPFNRDTGAIDFTAREEYVKYVDGRREDRTTTETSNSTNPPKSFSTDVDLSIGDVTAVPTGDSQDYHSVVEVTQKYSDDGEVYTKGKEFYFEDKDADGNVIKALTKGYSQGSTEKTGFFDLVTVSTTLENSSFSIFENGSTVDKTTTYSISDTGIEGSFNFLNLVKFNWNKDDIDQQSFSKSVKEVRDSIITLKNYETFYKSSVQNSWYKNWDQYGATIVEMSGTSSNLNGIVYRYSLYQKVGKRFNNGVLSRFPYADDKDNIDDLDGYYFTSRADAQSTFGDPVAYTISSTAVSSSRSESSMEYSNSESGSNSNGTKIIANGLKLLISDSIEFDTAVTETFNLSAIYDSENKKLTVYLKRVTGETVASIENASVKGSYLSGTINVNGKLLSIKIDMNSGSGEVGSGTNMFQF